MTIELGHFNLSQSLFIENQGYNKVFLFIKNKKSLKF